MYVFTVHLKACDLRKFNIKFSMVQTLDEGQGLSQLHGLSRWPECKVAKFGRTDHKLDYTVYGI